PMTIIRSPSAWMVAEIACRYEANVYRETSFIGYLTMRPQRNPLVLAHQQLTTEWWERRRTSFDLFVSEIVLEEVARGDAKAARERLAIVEKLAILRANDQAKRLTAAILKSA